MIRRWLLIFTVTITLLLTLPILLIRAQPYDGGHLGMFLGQSEHCRAPCLMGIRPGSTTLAQALAILRANNAIEHVQVENYYNGQSVFWRWKEGEPDFRHYAFRTDSDNTVIRPVMPSSITLGEVFLTLGEPAQVTAAISNEYQPRAIVMLAYPQRATYLLVGLDRCDIEQDQFWHMYHESGLYSSFYVGFGEPGFIRIVPHTHVTLDQTAWANQLRDFCRTM